MLKWRFAFLVLALLGVFQTACGTLAQRGISKSLEGFTKPISDWLTKEFGIWPAVILLVGAVVIGIVWGYRFGKKQPPSEK